MKKIKSFLKNWKLSSGTAEDWDNWERDTKLKYPIKWFFLESIPNWFDENIRWPTGRFFIDKLYWGFKYRFIKKHQYNIIRPKTLEPGYHNEYDLILHSNFHILKEFIEQEETGGIVDWSATLEHQHFWDESHRLLYWWNNIRPYREDWLIRDNPLPDGKKDWPNSWMLYNKYNKTDEYLKYTNILNIRIKADQQFEKDDNDYLIRLIKIRMFLWT